MMLQAERIYLRPPVKSDSPTILAWENATASIQVSSHEGEFILEDIENYINGINDIYLDEQLRLIVCLNSDQLIGSVDLFKVNFKAKTCDIGVLIASEEHKRKGYAKEALECAIRYIKDFLSIDKIQARVDETNEASLLLFQRMKFEKNKTKEGIVHFELRLIDEA